MIDQINDIIAKRTRYGQRQEDIPPIHTFLSWSNGMKGWFIVRYRSVEDTINLDANQIIVPFDKIEVEKILEQLDILPLDKHSFEARFKR